MAAWDDISTWVKETFNVGDDFWNKIKEKIGFGGGWEDVFNLGLENKDVEGMEGWADLDPSNIAAGTELPLPSAGSTGYRETQPGPATGPANIFLGKIVNDSTNKPMLQAGWVWSYSQPDVVDPVTGKVTEVRNKTESYRLIWYYHDGTGWINEGEETISINEKADQEEITTSKTRRHEINPAAKQYKVHIMPNPRSRKIKAGDTEYEEYWFNSTNTGVSKVVNVADVNLLPPANLKVEAEGDRIKVTVTPSEEQQLYIKKVEIRVLNTETNEIANTNRITLDINQTSFSGTYTGTFPPGGSYRVSVRTINENGTVQGPWTPWTMSDEVFTSMTSPKEITVLRTMANEGIDKDDINRYFIHLEWTKVKRAKQYKLEYTMNMMYFDLNDSAGIDSITIESMDEGIDPPNMHNILFGTIQDKIGHEIYFRVRAVDANNKQSLPTPVKSIRIGLRPEAPTTWSSDNSIEYDSDRKPKLYFVHNAPDGCDMAMAVIWYKLKSAEDKTWRVLSMLRIVDGDGIEKLKINSTISELFTGNTGIDNNTCWVELNSGADAFAGGDTFIWNVTTTSINTTTETGGQSPGSVVRTVDIYPQPEVSLLLQEPYEDIYRKIGDYEYFTTYPLRLRFQARGVAKTQKCITTSINIYPMQSYEFIDEFGNKKVMAKDNSIFSRIINAPKGDNVQGDQYEDIYLTPADVMFMNGITYRVSVTSSFNTGLHASKETHFTPALVCSDVYPQANVGFDPVSLTAAIQPYAMDKNGEYINNVTMDIYRKDYDGKFLQISSGIVPDTDVSGANLVHFDIAVSDIVKKAIADYKFDDTKGIRASKPGHFLRRTYLTSFIEWANNNVYTLTDDASKTGDNYIHPVDGVYTIPETRLDGSDFEYRDFLNPSFKVTPTTAKPVVVTVQWLDPIMLTYRTSEVTFRSASERISFKKILNPDTHKGYIDGWAKDGVSYPTGTSLSTQYNNILEINTVDDNWNALSTFRSIPIHLYSADNNGAPYKYTFSLIGLHHYVDKPVVLKRIVDPNDPSKDEIARTSDGRQIQITPNVEEGWHLDEFTISENMDVYVTVENLRKDEGIGLFGISLKRVYEDGRNNFELIDMYRKTNQGRTDPEWGTTYGRMAINYATVNTSIFATTIAGPGIRPKNAYDIVGYIDDNSIAYCDFAQYSSTGAYSLFNNWFEASFSSRTEDKIYLEAGKTYIARCKDPAPVNISYYENNVGRFSCLRKGETRRTTLVPANSGGYMTLKGTVPLYQATVLRDLKIAEDLGVPTGVNIVDPHPTLNFARYRIIARDNSSGKMSVYDTSPVLIGEKSIVIQWDENWSDFITDGRVLTDESGWRGSMLKLPYNIDIQNEISKDVTEVKYIGREHPVSYYGTHIGETATWKTDIPRDDLETIYALRRLQKYMGDVYVREPSGIGYWAHVDVDFPINHMTVVTSVTIKVTRVEGGI